MSARFEWERAVKGSDMPPTRKLILLTLATHANKGGKAWPSQARLAEECGLSDRAVRKHLAGAMSEGWLERTRTGRNVGRSAGESVTSEYRLRTPATGTGVPLADDVCSRNGCSGCQICNRNLDALQPEPGRVATGTGVPPISNREHSKNHCPHADLPRESDPVVSDDKGTLEQETLRQATPPVQQWQAAMRLGKMLAGVVETEDAMRETFENDPRLRNFPSLLSVTLNHWRRETAELERRSA
jgi:hypothetical protein